jgi:hypothetical protein
MLAKASLPVPASLRDRIAELEHANQHRLSDHRRAKRSPNLTPTHRGTTWLAAHLPDGAMARVGSGSREDWALTRNGEAVAFFRTKRETEHAAKGAQTPPTAQSHADLLEWVRILLDQLYATAASGARDRRPRCAELEWRLRMLLDGWALPSVVDRIAR